MALNPPIVRLYLLNQFRVVRDGTPVPDKSWRLRSARALVKILATDASHSLHRESIQEILWPEFTAEAAYNSFRKALHHSRHALEPDLRPKQPSAYIRLLDDVVSLVPEFIWLDTDEFESSARFALASNGAAPAVAALTLYVTELLPEDRYAEWTYARREHFARLHVQLLLHLARIREHEGAYLDAIARLQAVLAIDPLHDEAHHGLMRLYAARGSRHDALHQYQNYADVLRRNLDMEPDDDTEVLRTAIMSGDFATRSGSNPRINSRAVALPARAQRLLTREMINRTGALNMLSRELESVLAGSGGITLVSGEAGVGKSRLMAELARIAQEQNVIVLWGASYAREGVVPYRALVEALDDYLSGVALDERKIAAARYPELAQLIPALQPDLSAAPLFSGSEGTSARLFADLVRLLADIAAERPLLLVFDDLHSASDETLQVLHYLTRAATHRPWLILGAFREEEILPNSSLREFVVSVSRDGLCRQVELLRLAAADADELVRSVLGTGDVADTVLEKLFSLSLGNPLFLQQLLDAMRETGQVVRVDGTWQQEGEGNAAIPHQIEELIGLRIDRLSANAKDTLSLAALIGTHADLEVLRAASQLDERDLLDALDVATVAGFLEESEKGYVFRHPLFREALHGRLSRARKLSVHRAIAVAIETVAPEDVASLAFHYLRSGYDEPGLRYAELAGDRALSVHGHAAALAHYCSVLERIEHSGDPADIARVKSKVGDVLALSARHNEALEFLEDAVQIYLDLGDLDNVGRVTARIGHVHAFRGTPNEGADRIERLLSSWHDRPPSPVQAALWLQLGPLYYFNARYADGVVAGERASELARLVGDAAMEAEAENNRGIALVLMGRVNDGARVLRAAIPGAEAAEAWPTLSDLEGRLGLILAQEGEFDEAGFRAGRALAAAERTNDSVRLAIWTNLLAFRSLFLGEWEECLRYCARALQINEDLGDHNLAPYPMYVLGWLYFGKGERHQAWQIVEDGLILGEKTDNLQAKRILSRVLSELHLVEGRPQHALDLLVPLLDRPGLEEWDVTPLLPVLAWAQFELGRRDEADATCRMAIVRSEDQRCNIALADALRIHALVLAASGQTAEAEVRVAEAMTLTQNMPYPLAEGRALATWAAVLEGDGKLAEARSRLGEARSIFRRLGARRFEAQTRKDLQRITAQLLSRAAAG